MSTQTNQSHSILEKVKQVRTIENRWLSIYFCSLFVAFAIITLTLCCAIDYWSRSDQAWIRFGLSAVWLGLAIVFAERFLRPLLFRKQDDVSFVKRLERIDPSLAGQLSLAVDFLISDYQNGSTSLRRQVIGEVDRSFDPVRFLQKLQTKWPKRALLFLAGTLLAAGFLFGSRPGESFVALKRVINPFQEQPWPAFNELEFVDLPEKVAAAQPLDIVVVDTKNRLPRRVILEIDDGNRVRHREMRNKNGQGIFRIEKPTQTIYLRATGGDSSTGWQQVNVVKPPSPNPPVISIQPPKYSQLPTRTATVFQPIWQHSKIRIMGEADRPFEEAKINFLKSGNEFRCAVESDKFRFPANGWLDLNDSIEFKIEMRNNDGLVGGINQIFRLPIRIDQPPATEIQIENRREFYSRTAKVPITVFALDDMQLKSVKLNFSINGEPLPALSLTVPTHTARSANQLEKIELEFKPLIDLSKIDSVEEGSTLEFWSEAIDSKGESTESRRHELKIGSAAEIQRQTSHEQIRIHEQLKLALNTQIESKNLSELTLQAAEKKLWDSVAAQRIQRAIEQQRSVDTILYSKSGTATLCESFLQFQVAENQRDRISEVLSAIRSIQSEVSTAISQLNKVDSETKIASRASALQLAIKKQETCINTLRPLVGQIDEQAKSQNVLFELDLIRQQEIELKEQVKNLRDNSLAGDVPAAARQLQAQRLTNEQRSIAEQLQEIHFGIINDTSHSASPLLNRLSQIAKQSEIAAKSAANRLEEQQFGPAIIDIDKVIQLLQQTFKMQSGAGTQPLNRNEVKDAQKTVDQIRSNTLDSLGQLDNWNSLSDAEKNSIRDRLKIQQQNLSRFLAEHQHMLSDDAKALGQDTDQLFNEAADHLDRNELDDAKMKIREVGGNLDKIRSELDAHEKEFQRRKRTQLFRKIQQDLTLVYQKQKTLVNEVESTLSEGTEIRRKLIEDWRLRQNEVSQAIALNAESASELFALRNQLGKLLKLSSEIETKLKNPTEASASLNDTKLTMDSLLALLESIVKLHPEADSKNNNKKPNENQKNTKTDNSSSDIEITDLEVQMIRLIQEEIRTETIELQKLRSQPVDGATQARLKKKTLVLSEKQGNLILIIDKYLDAPAQPKTNKQDPNNEIPKIDIPKIEDQPDIPDLPDLPNLDCGVESIDAKQEKETQEKKRDGDQKQPQAEAVRPFAPEGEDIGKDADNIRNRLSSVKEKMELVQELLIQQKFAKENQDKQSEIIKELKEFSTQQQKKTGKNKQNQKNEQKKQAGNQAATNSKVQGDSNQDNNQSNSDANDSRQSRFDQIWGHLPEKLRQNELSIRPNSYLPKYKQLISDYFKRLAEESPRSLNQ